MLVKLVTYSNATFTLTSKLRKTRDVTSVIYQYILRVAETELKYAKKEKKLIDAFYVCKTKPNRNVLNGVFYYFS
jgi:hypothetical protein